MEHIKNSWKLFKLDWQRIFKNPIATGLIIALMVLPSLYAWFNIKALWDPYANTSELPIAVYSDDQTQTFSDQSINIGDKVLEKLHDNDQLGWRFVDSKAELDQGVKSGKYYAGIYLPKDFSKNLLSFTTGEIVKPQIEYSVNEKINAIAPKITSKGATSLQSQISEEFIETASSTLLEVFNEIGYDLDSNLVSLTKVKNMILETDENSAEIDKYAQQIVALHDKFPELKEKLAQANELEDYLPKIDELGQKVVTLNDNLPALKQEAAIILTLQEKIPEIQAAGEQLAMVDEDFDSVAQTMTEGIEEAKQGLVIIQGVQTALPEIQKVVNQGNELATEASAGAAKLQEALPSISASLKVTLQAVQLVGTNVEALTSQILAILPADGELTAEQKEQIAALVQQFSSSLEQQQNAIQRVTEILTAMQATSDDPNIPAIIEKLNSVNALLGDLKAQVDSLDVNQLSVADLRNKLNEINALAQTITATAASIDVDAVTTKVNELLTTFIDTISTAQGLLAQAQQVDIDALLTATSATVSNAITILEKYQAQLPAIKQEIHDANELLNGHMDTIVNGINKGADLYNNELPILEQKLATAASFVQNDYPALKEEVTTTLDTVNEKMPPVEAALDKATDLIQNDWPTIQTGLHKAAEAIRKGENEVDLGEVIKLLKLDANKESEFFMQPVEITENRVYPIANNGSASTPFYTALCIWVGAVLFSSIATTDYHLDKKDRGRYSKREQFTARMMTFLVVGFNQGLVVALGNYFLLGVSVKQPVYSVLFALLIALTFMMMVYVLVALFGNIGKGAAIIILVLSISGGGGNYPIQVSGKFFQMINPFLPFTHAVNLLRESAGGIYWPNAWFDILLMILLFTAFGVLGTLFYPAIEQQTKKLTKVSHESHIFH